MREAIEKFFSEKIRPTPGERLLVGVSGGADSVALLHLLHAVAPGLSLAVHVAHLDHALRPESAHDALFVAELCREWGLPLTSERIDVGTEARRRGLGIEEGARLLRRDFLESTASDQGCRWIVLGHHRGDQAETVIHRLLRGTAVSGLAAMAFQNGSYLRPLLDCTRNRILSYLHEQGLPWREDASNADPRFTRNRLRHEVMPLLAEFNPQLEEALCRLSRRVFEEEDFWQLEEGRALEQVRDLARGESALDRAGLLRLHPALRHRVIRRAIREVRGHLDGVSSAHLASVEKLLQSERPQAEVHLPGIRVRRRYESLCFDPGSLLACDPFTVELGAPGSCTLPDGRMVRAQLFAEMAGEGPTCVEFDAEAVSFPLTIRSFCPGDRFHPAGAAGGKKLKDFFIDRKIDSELRRALPLVVSGDILWVIGVRRSDGRRPVSGRPVLRLEVLSAPKFRQLTC